MADVGNEPGEQETKVDREHDRILKEIETTDPAFIGASLRAVYEGNDHEKFLDRLDARIKQHDRDIEKLCNHHYHGFIESITELIKVRSEAENLKSKVVSINKDLQESGKDVQRRCQDQIQCRIQQRNISSAIESLTMCLPVLEMYAKMQEQMNSKRYYSALKTLEQLERTYLPLVHKYRFCEIMIDNIPEIRKEIKKVSMSELKDFLESVRKKSSKIGTIAMKQVDKERKLEGYNEVISTEVPILLNNGDNLTNNLMNHNSPKLKSRRKKPHLTDPNVRTNPFDESYEEADTTNPFESNSVEEVEGNPFATNNETDHSRINGHDANPFVEKPPKKETVQMVLEDENIKDISPSDVVDFSPVYKCMHIFGILKSHEQFEKYYRSQRHTQARLALQPPLNMHESLDGYSSYFHQIVGFFVVEDHVLHTAQNLIDRMYMNELWEMALTEIVAVLRAGSGYCTESDMMMKLKNLIVVFADTLKAYGFDVDQLFTLLIEMKDQYGEILLKKWSSVFQVIFNEDNYTPMQLHGDIDAMKIKAGFPVEVINDPDFDKPPFPKVLPFSKFVPSIYAEIKSFISACLSYCEDLHLSQTEVDDMIRKSTNLLLTRTLSAELKTLVAKPNLGLTELVQVTINTQYLESSCRYVEDFVHSVTGVDSSASHTARLVGVSTFKDARSETESQIYLKVNSKIDEFFELAGYNWTVNEPEGHASNYLLDLIAFLKHNFSVFTNLPTKVAQTACMSACKHIATRLMELLLDPDMKFITMAALQHFNLDVMQCELFSNSEPVPGLDGVLQMSFIELRQLLDLFLSWDWSSYLADYGSGNSKYLRVHPATALTLLEKVREDTKRRNIFASFSKEEREKKKLLETVLKQLRNIVSGTSAT